MCREPAIACREVRAHRRQRERRRRADLLLRERAEYSQECSALAAREKTGDLIPEQVRGALQVVRRDGVLDGALSIAVTLVPGACPLVEDGLEGGLTMRQHSPQGLREQWVVAVLAVGPVEGDDEQVHAGQLRQQQR